MAAQLFKNNFDWAFIGPVTASTHVGFESTIGKGILQISDAASALLPNPTGGDWYVLTSYKRAGSVESAVEILKVLGVNEVAYAGAGECRIRVERGHEGTTPQTYVAGDLISMRITAGGLNALASDAELGAHTSNTSNPHSVTKAQVGLANVDNTSDADKPVSTDQATAIDLRQATSDKDASGGYAGLTAFKLNLKNTAGTITSWFTTAATAARTWAMQDKDGTVAMTSDVHDATAKTTPVDADELGVMDSAASFGLKKLTWANLKATLAAWLAGGTVPLSVTTVTCTGLNGGGIPRVVLTGNIGYYVRTDGSDSNTGLANTAGAAFLTIQKAINVAAKLDNAGYAVIIYVADGTYTGSLSCPAYLGAGQISVRGNTVTPANCVISMGAGQNIAIASAANYDFQGFKLSGLSTTGFYLPGTGSQLYFGSIDFALTGVGAIHFYLSGTGCFVYCTANYTISQSAYAHVYGAIGNANQFTAWNKTITLSGTPAWGASFVYVSNGTYAHIFSNCVFSGAATGPRYTANANAVISVDGAGVGFLPGNSAGGTATGGQYV